MLREVGFASNFGPLPSSQFHSQPINIPQETFHYSGPYPNFRELPPSASFENEILSFDEIKNKTEVYTGNSLSQDPNRVLCWYQILERWKNTIYFFTPTWVKGRYLRKVVVKSIIAKSLLIACRVLWSSEKVLGSPPWNEQKVIFKKQWFLPKT